jgi:D-alanyl-D-alanine endopeptidase (penicillin-binding protein 7)
VRSIRFNGMKWVCAAAVALALGLGGVAPGVAAPAASTSAQVAKPGKPGKAAKATKTAKAAKPAKVQRNGKRTVRKVAVRAEPARPSFGQLSGLRATEDDLALKSSVALVVDQDTDEVLFSKNSHAVLPIASITKLMTALVVTEAQLPLDEQLTVTQDDVAATAGSKSRLKLGTQLTRGEMLHLALMASENRAAHLLGRTFPGGLDQFVGAMNGKARELGMNDTRYVEPTGLSSNNQSSAEDLTRLVRAAFEHPIIRQLSTSLEAVMPVGHRPTQFRNTNGLVRNPEWDIGLQKTGYISAAGRCVVMQTQLAGRKLIMVLLDSAGKYSRIGDAERIRKWLAETSLIPAAMASQPR